MIIAYVPQSTPVPPPPIVQRCDYQIEITNDYPRTYECFTRNQYESYIQSKQIAAQQIQQAHILWFYKWWWVGAIGIGVIIWLSLLA